jgi:trimethylamine--corrinoid protein Co-methyltransferase
MVRKGLAGGSFQPLTKESVDKIHQTVMAVVEEVGFEVNSEKALKLFEKAGARVDREELRVRLPQETGSIPERGEPPSISMSRLASRRGRLPWKT